MICFAILAHENEEVLQDQVENVLAYNPGAKVVLYNGGINPDFGKETNVQICPYSRPLQKGRLGRFLLDVIKWLEEIDFDYDYLVNLDSDMLFIRQGYEKFLEKEMQGYDCMGINFGIQHSPDEVFHWYPGQTMWREWDRWQPFFGTDYICGSLNCMQVYRKGIAKRITDLIDQEKLEQLMESSAVFALEEILCPTLAVKAGASYRAYPIETAGYVRLGDSFTKEEAENARNDSHAYFIHPVKRDVSDPARTWIRDQAASYPKLPSSLTIVWGCYQGGVETVMMYRLNEMNARGGKAHIYFYYGGAGLDNFQHIPHCVSNNSYELIRYIKQNSFDVLTFVNTLHNLDKIADSGFKGTCLFELHGFAPSILSEIKRIDRKEDYGLIKGIVVPCNYVAGLVSAVLWNRTDIEIFVSRNPLNTVMFQKQQAETEISNLKLPPAWKGSKLIGWVGRLQPGKNWRLLLRIFRKVKKKVPNAKLLVASDLVHSPDLNDFFKLAQAYNLVYDLQVLPNVPYTQMPSYYSLIANSGGVLLSTSHSEGYPYHLLEAQACECPVVCTMTGGSMEVVAHGLTGFVYPAQQVNEAVDYLCQLFEDQELRCRITGPARERICVQNAVEKNVRVYVEWLHSRIG